MANSSWSRRAILDYLDELAGPERALLPRAGAERRQALNLMAMATGAAEKGVLQVYERVFRPGSEAAPALGRSLPVADERDRSRPSIATSANAAWRSGWWANA